MADQTCCRCGLAMENTLYFSTHEASECVRLLKAQRDGIIKAFLGACDYKSLYYAIEDMTPDLRALIEAAREREGKQG